MNKKTIIKNLKEHREDFDINEEEITEYARGARFGLNLAINYLETGGWVETETNKTIKK